MIILSCYVAYKIPLCSRAGNPRQAEVQNRVTVPEVKMIAMLKKKKEVIKFTGYLVYQNTRN